MLKFLVTGTGTGIGKTIVTSLLTDFLKRNNRRIFAYKPIQTGAEKIDGKLLAADPEIYKLIGNVSTRNKPYTYLLQTPSSPHLAAKNENIDYNLAKIHQDIKDIQKNNDGIVVEGAGGLYVPITEEGYSMIDFIKELDFPVILVGEAGLGTINHTVLSIKALEAYKIPIIGVILNGTGKEDRSLELDNVKMIEQLTNVPVVGTVPFVKNIEYLLPEKEHRIALTKDWNRKIIESGR